MEVTPAQLKLRNQHQDAASGPVALDREAFAGHREEFCPDRNAPFLIGLWCLVASGSEMHIFRFARAGIPAGPPLEFSRRIGRRAVEGPAMPSVDPVHSAAGRLSLGIPEHYSRCR